MGNKNLQTLVDNISKQYGIKQRIEIDENILDVPPQLLNLHMLSNALAKITRAYKEENATELKRYSVESQRKRKSKI